MSSYKRGSGTSPDVHSKWSHLVLIVVEYFGQQRSLNRECVRTLRKDWVILHGSSMICMYHYLRQSPRYRASWCFRCKFDWLVLGDSLEIESVVLIEDGLFAFLRCTFGSSVYCWGWKQWHWCFEPGKIHCWTVEILGGKSCGEL